MGQGDHHGKGAVEQELQRLVDDTEADEARIDDPVEAEDDLPGEDPQQIAGPEGDGDQDQPEHLVAGDPEGQEIGHGIGEQHHGDGRHQGQDDRFDQQDGIDGIGQGKGNAPPIGRPLRGFDQAPVIVEGEGRIDAVEILGPEADQHQGDDGNDQHRQHEQHGGRQEEIAAQPFIALQQAAALRPGARCRHLGLGAANSAHQSLGFSPSIRAIPPAAQKYAARRRVSCRRLRPTSGRAVNGSRGRGVGKWHQEH